MDLEKPNLVHVPVRALHLERVELRTVVDDLAEWSLSQSRSSSTKEITPREHIVEPYSGRSLEVKFLSAVAKIRPAP